MAIDALLRQQRSRVSAFFSSLLPPLLTRFGFFF
jgi:hypothetical protein